jgi:hypothetical protein
MASSASIALAIEAHDLGHGLFIDTAYATEEFLRRPPGTTPADRSGLRPHGVDSHSSLVRRFSQQK